MIQNLQKDDHPVLLEGIHCTYYLLSGELNGRKVIVRLHNAEFEYYYHLALHEKNPFKKLYFRHESMLLKRHENMIAKKALIAAVSIRDMRHYQQLFGAKNIHHLPVFLPFTEVVGKEGNGCFCLYHGNLAINENEKAAIWLMDNVFNGIDIPFVIAGKNPSQKLEFLANEQQHTCLIANPADKEIQDLIARAQINILPSFNNTGVKLKLLNALFNGRHCIVNDAGVAGSGLEAVCHIAEDAKEFQVLINELYGRSFTKAESKKRQELLQKQYNNETNARQLMSWIW